MPRKKQKGPPPRANRPGGPKQDQGAGQGKGKTAPASAQQKGGKQNPAQGSGAGNGSGPQKLQVLQQNQRPIVPFLRGDRILLIGEGEWLLLFLFWGTLRVAVFFFFFALRNWGFICIWLVWGISPCFIPHTRVNAMIDPIFGSACC
jgi:hypothetical protein